MLQSFTTLAGRSEQDGYIRYQICRKPIKTLITQWEIHPRRGRNEQQKTDHMGSGMHYHRLRCWRRCSEHAIPGGEGRPSSGIGDTGHIIPCKLHTSSDDCGSGTQDFGGRTDHCLPVAVPFSRESEENPVNAILCPYDINPVYQSDCIHFRIGRDHCRASADTKHCCDASHLFYRGIRCASRTEGCRHQ